MKHGDPDRLVCTRCAYVFYLDPKVAVGTIIDDGGGRVVLVRRAIEHSGLSSLKQDCCRSAAPG